MMESDFQQLQKLLAEKGDNVTEPKVPWNLKRGFKVVKWNVMNHVEREVGLLLLVQK